MADKKKMSVADILAAARKADGGAKADGDKGESPADQPKQESAAADTAASPKAKAAQDKPKQAPPGGAGMSVADILAAARGQGQAAPEKPAEKPAQAKQPAKAKPAAKAAPSTKDKPAAQPAASGPMDTASILAAARKTDKPGPMSKAEAAKLKPSAAPAALKQPETKKTPAKPAAPPMPTKPEYARGKPAKAPAADEDRRTVVGLVLGTFLGMGFTALSATFGLWSLLTARFMFPNVLMEPPNQFKVGFPANFPPDTVDTRFKAKFGVWIVNTEYEGVRQIVALKSVCTHLGCTPNWLDAEQKFKCPCHGSGFYIDGVNFEGPAPRPLERYAIRLADDGQIEVDKSATFQEEMGQWIDKASFVAV